MSRAKLEVYEKLFASTFNETRAAAEAVPENLRLRQLAPGKAHPLWLVGHLAFDTDIVINMILLGGKSITPREYRVLFGPDVIGGNPPGPSAAAYPSWDEVLGAYVATTTNTRSLLSELNDDVLAGGAVGKVPQGHENFFTSFNGVLDMMLLHDSYHRGQMVHLSKLPLT